MCSPVSVIRRCARNPTETSLSCQLGDPGADYGRSNVRSDDIRHASKPPVLSTEDGLNLNEGSVPFPVARVHVRRANSGRSRYPAVEYTQARATI